MVLDWYLIFRVYINGAESGELHFFPFFVCFFSFLKKAKIWIGSSWDVLIIWKKKTKYLCYSYMYTGWRWQTRCPKHSNVEEFGFMWGLIGKRIIEWKLLHLVKDLFLSQTECGTELLLAAIGLNDCWPLTFVWSRWENDVISILKSEKGYTFLNMKASSLDKMMTPGWHHVKPTSLSPNAV